MTDTRGPGGHGPGDEVPEAPRIFSEAYYVRLHAVEQSHWYVWGMRQAAQALLRAHRFRGAGLVLDVGCGTGGTLRWLLDRFPGVRVVGLDVAAEALRHARGQGALPVLQGSATQLPFPAATFDLVVSFDVLQHLPGGTGDVAALREAVRVLRPGGLFLARAAAVRRGDPTGVVSPDGYHRFTPDELSGKVRGAGLRVLRATFVNCLLSLVEDARRALRPRGPTHGGDPGLGIRPPRHRWLAAGQRLIMALEALYLARPGRRLPSGHSLMVLAVKEPPTL